MIQVGFGEALRFWLKLGFISFGGPAGQIAIMHTELVERRRWISEKRFLHALNYCMLLPGPEAQQLATYIGWLMHRTRGGLAAGGLFVLPSLFILIALSWIYVRFGNQPLVAALFFGLKPAVTALVLHAAHRIGTRALRNAWLWAHRGRVFRRDFLLRRAVPGHRDRRRRSWVGSARSAGRRCSRSAAGMARPGCAMVRRSSTTTRRRRRTRDSREPVSCACSLTGLVLWAVAFAALTATFGAASTLAAMGWFFTKAALVTFGGAYAVLPYVYQGAVETHQWLSGPQMIDGLALGETTPGPLIMVVAFVGFVGGWLQRSRGARTRVFLGAALGATVATFFTFLPSFVFIFAGGPLVEATHGKVGFTAPLSAITAAVVGVMANLALVLRVARVLAAGRSPAGFDWVAALIAVGAGVALFRFNVGVLTLLGASAAVGLVASSLGA